MKTFKTLLITLLIVLAGCFGVWGLYLNDVVKIQQEVIDQGQKTVVDATAMMRQQTQTIDNMRANQQRMVSGWHVREMELLNQIEAVNTK